MIRTSLIAGLLLAATCSSPLPPPSDAEQQAAIQALDLLQRVQITTLAGAFEAISTHSHTRHTRIVRQTNRHFRTSSRVVHYGPSRVPVVLGERIDEYFGETLQLPSDVADLPSAIASESLNYTIPRFRDEYTYRVRSDTLIWTRPAQVIDISARPGSNQDVRHARYVIDQASGILTAYELEISSLDMLYKEHSHYLFQLRPGLGDMWVPYQAHIDIRLGLPLGRSRYLTRHITCYNYDGGL